MRIHTLALANLRRRKGKATFLAAAIALGLGTVVALLSLSGAIRREIGTQLDQFGANVVVVPKSDSFALGAGGTPEAGAVAFDVRELSDADVAALRAIPYANRLSAVAPKLVGAAEVDGRRAVVVGVDFASELRLKRWWRVSGAAPRQDREVLVGYDAARDLGLMEGVAPTAAAPAGAHDHHGHHAGHGAGHGSPASRPAAAAAAPPAPSPPPMPMGPGHDHSAGTAAPEIRLAKERITIGGGGGGEFRVTGVLSPTGGSEDRAILAPLPTVQALLGKPGKVSLIEVSALCKDCPIEEIVDQIGQALPHARVTAVQQAVRAREHTVERLGRFAVSVSAVVLAIAALLVFTTMAGSVVERRGEIGVLRAIGFRRSHIARQLFLEVAVISLAGGLAGWALGAGAGRAALPYFAETERSLELGLMYLPLAVGGALLIGVASSLLPIYRASRLDPAESVRQV